MTDYIVLYREVNGFGNYKIIHAKNIITVCKIWYTYCTGNFMTGAILDRWSQFHYSEFEDCIAWVNSFIADSLKINKIICGMYMTACPSKIDNKEFENK